MPSPRRSTRPWPPQTGEFDSDGFSQVYDAWWESVRGQAQEEGYADGLTPFFAASIQQFLSGEPGKNRAYSPLNVYMALGMLAELTDGESRQQILDLAGGPAHPGPGGVERPLPQ